MGLLRYSPRILEPEAMVTPDEVRAYDRLSAQYLDILHKGFVETVLGGCPAGGSVLEIGTGTGRIAALLARHGPGLRITGVDLSPDMLVVARENVESGNVGGGVALVLGDAKRLPFPDGAFDAVVSHNMLHHLPDPLPLVDEAFRVAKPDGAVFIRDLVRPPDSLIPWHAAVFGFGYDPRMKRQYLDSMRAALTWAEWRALFARHRARGAVLSRQFLTHATIARPWRGGDSGIRLPGSTAARWARRLYVGCGRARPAAREPEPSGPGHRGRRARP